jgi:very-short-patch-repair endonuclease
MHCRNKHNNQFICGSRSKAEQLLENSLKNEFPKLQISTNDRHVLEGKELDFYIPELKTAIEWNGIFHQKAVKGDDIKVWNEENKNNP